jgi:RsiW-degrading membrane proteinase PrsW (M82 family)
MSNHNFPQEPFVYIQLFLLAFIPSITVLILFFFSDRYEKEPLHMLFFCFICGAALSIPMTLLLAVFPGFFAVRFPSELWTIFFRSFVIAALIEEGLKFWVVRRVVIPSPYFNEPFDGMVYYVAVAAGFAVYEDFTYILASSAKQFLDGRITGNLSAFYTASLSTAVVRALPGHALFGAISGFFLAKGKFARAGKSRFYYFITLISGVLCHGIFNIIAYTQKGNAVVLLILYSCLLLLIVIPMAVHLLKSSPFNKPRIKLSLEERNALWQSKTYSSNNLGMFLVLSVLVMMGILIIFFVNMIIIKMVH